MPNDLVPETPTTPSTEVAAPTTPEAQTQAAGGSLISGEPPAAAPASEASFAPIESIDSLRSALPEGVQVEDSDLQGFVDLLNGAESREALAQSLIAQFVTAQQQALEAQAEAWNETQNEWQNAVRSSPEFGGENLGPSLAVAKEVFETYGGKEFLELLDQTGLGNHIATVRLAHALKKDLPSEARPAAGTPAPSTEKSSAQILFGATSPN